MRGLYRCVGIGYSNEAMSKNMRGVLYNRLIMDSNLAIHVPTWMFFVASHAALCVLVQVKL